ncbi:helix-turn-helix transcriptional regulator [Actinokineospora sp. NBRC 105648]|uniref:helix-turn-helix domain-containing protein n=1 Tax=Actinokineospora sp. NBRC 105648 TaxID=3032206 RepID=UPI0024A3363D|nr:helix-turn-helix transcriptional regulator [Actinokineospora sp. NBRC 105648]GLZ37739.1 transcriptional regulator [Actinokineospora sp. NBRC 105648]
MAIGQRRTADRIQVGATLKRMRLEADISREEAAEKLDCTITTISNIEQGRTRVSQGNLTLLLELYRSPDDQVADLLAVNRQAHRAVARISGGMDIQPHQRRAGDLIRAARQMRFYSPEVFHGILQAESYARAIMAPSGHVTPLVETRLRYRLSLADVLTRETESPLQLWAVVGEATLRKNIGGPVVMRQQLRHVAELCRTRENVTVQVLPLGAREHELIGATVTIYNFDRTIHEIASVDTTLGDLFFERDSTVTEAINKFDDVRLKALDPLTSVDMMEDLSGDQ